MKTYDIVIVGNSAAGLSAVKTIRKYNKIVSIAIVDKENSPAYSRVLTPYYVGGKIKRNNLFIVNINYYRENNVDTYFGESLVNIDIDKKIITTDNDRSIGYKKLLLAIGAEAVKTHIQHNKAMVLRHMQDADIMIENLKNAQCVAGFGGGLVTIPTMSHINKNIEKHIIISSNRIFSRVLDKEASMILETYFKKQNIQIHKQNNIDLLKEMNNGKIILHLHSGDSITADALIVGKGVKPNIDIAKKSGVSVHYGIVVDKMCRTDAQDIYAAGDTAEGTDYITKDNIIQGNWITAVEQGEIAAKNIIGMNVIYNGSVKNNTTDVFGIDIAAIGYNRDDAPKTETFYNEHRTVFRKIFLDEKDVIIGATIIGESNDAGLYYGMIMERMRFQSLKHLNQYINYAKILRTLDYR